MNRFHQPTPPRSSVRIRRRIWIATVVLVAQAAILPARAWPQATPGGAVAGHAHGPGGVSVPGATLLLVNTQTGERRETWTDEAGNYAFSNIPPGTYRLETSLVGFRSDVREPIPVTAEKTVRVNLSLALESPASAEPANLVRRRDGLSGPPNLDSLPPEARARIEQLPTGAMGGEESGVRFTEGAAAAGTGAGVSNGETGGEATGGASEGAGSDLSQQAENSFLLSGSTVSAPTPAGEEGQRRERGEQFRQYRQSQSAPGFGGGGPGFEGAMMFFGGRGGFNRPQVNKIRGSFFDRFTNSAFDARPYPLNTTESHQIATYQEQAGLTLGGPLNIPKIYNGGKKASFFINYNFQRGRSPFDTYATVPTLAERAGDFSKTVIPTGPLAGTVPVIYDPATGTAPFSNPQPFAGNMVPPGRMDNASLALLNYIPTPNLPEAVQNFHLQKALPSYNDRFMGRIGYQLNPKDSINGFYNFNSSRSETAGSFPAFTSKSSVRGQNLNLGETHAFGPHIVNTLLLNFNRQRREVLNPFAFHQDISGAIGIQGVSTNPYDWGAPFVSFTNFTGLNDTIPSLARNQTVRAVDSLMVNKGRHTVRLGGEMRRVELNTLTDPNARGTFTFTGYTTSAFSPQGLPLSGSGFDFADFLLGLPQSTSERFGASANYLRSWVYGGFVMDDWRASPRLTFNLGLRFEYFQPFVEKYGHLSDLDLGPNFSTVGVITGQDNFPASLLRADENNFAPRVGIAFRPWTKRHWVMRAGYGVFYDGSIYQRLVPNLVDQPPFAQASTLLTASTQLLTLENGFPTLPPSLLRNTYAVDPAFRTPYGQTWSFGFENEIARDLILSVNYVGTKGTKLDLLLGPNSAMGGSTVSLKNAQQFTYETSGASSIYNGLQVTLRRQFHRGFSISGYYTYSKSIDDAASVGGAGRTVAQNYLDLAAERSLSSFDVRHRLLINDTYEFPFGQRHRYLNRGGKLAGLLGDWQASGSATIQSGTPFTARVLGNQGASGATGAYFATRADATGLPVALPASERTTVEYFNTAAFALPSPGQYGNAGRDTIPGPSTVNFNMSLDKQLTFSQEKSVRGDFRIESGNVFNTPTFTGLSTVINAADFGHISSVGTMRTLAVSLRVRF